MSAAIEDQLRAAVSANEPCFIGQIACAKTEEGFVLMHRADAGRADLKIFHRSDDAVELAKFDDAGNYRPLKTAPNLRHGWRMELDRLSGVRSALDYFYPGRLAVLLRWKQNELRTTPLRATLERQSGMYRVAASVSDAQLDGLIANFCRSDAGCLRTILWKRDAAGNPASPKLPGQKFDPKVDQAAQGAPGVTDHFLPLLCQEACNLLVNECRKAVKEG